MSLVLVTLDTSQDDILLLDDYVEAIIYFISVTLDTSQDDIIIKFGCETKHVRHVTPAGYVPR